MSTDTTQKSVTMAEVVDAFNVGPVPLFKGRGAPYELFEEVTTDAIEALCSGLRANGIEVLSPEGEVINDQHH